MNITEIGDHSIGVSGNSIVNIYYSDEYFEFGGDWYYQPGTRFSITASGNAIVNFIYPEGDPFEVYILYSQWNGTEEEHTTIDTFAGLQISSETPPFYSDSADIYRYYGPGVPSVLTPYIGTFTLHDNAVINFVPEPGTLLLLSASCILALRRPS